MNKQGFRTKDIRLASLIWVYTGECPRLEEGFPKVFVFSYHPEIAGISQRYYTGQTQEIKVAELFDKYNALKNLARLGSEEDGR